MARIMLTLAMLHARLLIIFAYNTPAINAGGIYRAVEMRLDGIAMLMQLLQLLLLMLLLGGR